MVNSVCLLAFNVGIVVDVSIAFADNVTTVVGGVCLLVPFPITSLEASLP